MTERHTPDDGVDAVHLTPQRIASFVDRQLHDADRVAVVRHVADCDDCRRELFAVQHLLDSAPVRRRRGWLAIAAGLAAVLLVSVVSRFPEARLPDARTIGTSAPGAERGVSVDEPPMIQGVLPAEGDMVTATPATFAWRSVGAEATYGVSVQDSVGALLWSATTGDTSVTLPDTVHLAPGNQYFWSVDAQRVDGRSTRSGVYRFSVR